MVHTKGTDCQESSYQSPKINTITLHPAGQSLSFRPTMSTAEKSENPANP